MSCGFVCCAISCWCCGLFVSRYCWPLASMYDTCPVIGSVYWYIWGPVAVVETGAEDELPFHQSFSGGFNNRLMGLFSSKFSRVDTSGRDDCGRDGSFGASSWPSGLIRASRSKMSNAASMLPSARINASMTESRFEYPMFTILFAWLLYCLLSYVVILRCVSTGNGPLTDRERVRAATRARFSLLRLDGGSKSSE